MSNLIKTPIVLYLVDQSSVKHKGILDDIVISMDPWEYITNFKVLQPKYNIRGYPLILGRPRLVTFDAYIGYISRHDDIPWEFN